MLIDARRMYILNLITAPREMKKTNLIIRLWTGLNAAFFFLLEKFFFQFLHGVKVFEKPDKLVFSHNHSPNRTLVASDIS